jgi:plastocyanin
MKQLRFIATALITGILSITIFSCSKTDAYNPPVNAGDSSLHKVNIQATQFDPATFSMLFTTSVTWTNVDSGVHTLVSDDGTSFNSGNIAAGGSFSYTPTIIGTIAYHCGIHPTVKGTIYVVSR